MERNRRIAPQSGPNDAVASRLAALETLIAHVEGRRGPVLLTGEPGAGKTWLRRRLTASLPPRWKAVVVETAPAIDAVDFLTLTAAKLGVAPLPDRPAMLRLAIEKLLDDEACDDRPRLLIVEDSHHAVPEVWAEIEALCDHLGDSGGFAAALLIGRSELTRRMAAPSLRAMASRLSKHVHLPPLNLDETSRLFPGVDADELEILHRDAAGNPRRLLALAGDRIALPAVAPPSPIAEAPPPPPSLPSRSVETAPSPPTTVVPHPGAPKVTVPVEPRQSPPALLPSRPPLRIEDGLIEVGWAGDLEPSEDDAPAAAFVNAPVREEEEEEVQEEGEHADGDLVDDHYAALQAWSEWARNRDRLSRTPLTTDAVAEAEAEVEEEAAAVPEMLGDVPVPEVDEPSDYDSPVGEGLRAEPPHDHAPYSQLFGKLRMSN